MKTRQTKEAKREERQNLRAERALQRIRDRFVKDETGKVKPEADGPSIFEVVGQ